MVLYGAMIYLHDIYDIYMKFSWNYSILRHCYSGIRFLVISNICQTESVWEAREMYLECDTWMIMYELGYYIKEYGII